MAALLKDLLRPADVRPNQVAACLGLISDTHCPERLDQLPDSVFRIFRGVDLILHAGDIGALSVLDQLSAAAPVVAVHGNDERQVETQRELPYQQVVSVAGQRIVLTHAHYADLEQEIAARRDDAWEPKLDRRASFGHRAGARLVVYGHTHIPTDVEHQGVRLINPGALASGHFTYRQAAKTVALLYVLTDGTSRVVHVDLAAPDRPFAFAIDWAAGFRAALLQFQSALLNEEDLAAHERLRASVRALGAEAYLSLRDIMRHACMLCWTGARDRLGWDDIVRAIETAPEITPTMRATLASLAVECRSAPQSIE